MYYILAFYLQNNSMIPWLTLTDQIVKSVIYLPLWHALFGAAF